MPLGTLVDSNVLLDVFTEDQRWGRWSAEQLVKAFDAGEVRCRSADGTTWACGDYFPGASRLRV
jgi:hypothetical protein